MQKAESGLDCLSQARAPLRAGHPNVLVVGSEASVVAALRGLRASCRQPVVTCEGQAALELPSHAQMAALILRDVDQLSLEGQHRLMAWLGDGRGRTQVIATSADALWPHVEDGSFLDGLYYRLNVIFIDLTDGPTGGDGHAASV